MSMFSKSWKDYNTDAQEVEKIEKPILPARCFLGAAGILCLVLVGIVLVIVGLSL